MSKITIKSEVTGSIWKVLVQEGAVVKEDDVLILVESMKMEIPVMATDSGRVTQLIVNEGDPVSEGDPVVIIESD